MEVDFNLFIAELYVKIEVGEKGDEDGDVFAELKEINNEKYSNIRAFIGTWLSI